MAITANTFLGKKKGGALAVRPKTNIVPVKGKGSSIEKVDPENPTLVIRTKLIRIEDILKGTLAAEKKAADERKKAKEQEERAEEEKDIEADPKSKTKFKLPLPGKIKSWWENIKRFFFTVLFGWLFLKFMEWLPKLKGILKLLAGIAEFVLDWGGRILNGLVTFVGWGMKAYDWTRDKVEDIFGKKGVEAFDKVSGILSTVLNLIMGLGLAMMALSNELGGDSPGRDLGSTRRGFNRRQLTNTRGNQAIRRYIRRHGIDAARRRFGNTAVRNLGGKFGRSGATNLARRGVTSVLGRQGTRTGLRVMKNFISPIVKRIPLIGALMDFALNVFVFKESPGRAAFKAIGAGLGLWVGGALGTLIPVPFVGTAIGAFLGGAGGDMLGGAIYDMIFGGKKEAPKPPNKNNNEKNIKSSNNNDKSKSISNYPSYENGASEEIVVIRRPMGRSAAKNRSENEKEVIALDTGTGFNVSFNSSSLYR